MRHIRSLLSRLRALARSPQMDRDLDDEIAAHLAEATDEYVARGLSPEEARMAALRRFGGVVQTKEEYREARSFGWLDDLGQDLRLTRRTFAGNPAFTLVAIVTLTLGIGANTTIFTLLDAVVLKPLPVPAARDLVTFYENGPEGIADAAGGTGRYLRFSYPRFILLRQALDSHGSLAAVTRSSRFSVHLPGAPEAHFVQAQMVSGGYFATLGISASRGRVLTDDDVRVDRVSPVVVISDGFSNRILGGADAAIGQSVIVNGLTAIVVGVTPPGFFGMWTDSESDMWLPLTLQSVLRYDNNTSGYGRVDSAKPWLAQDNVAWLNLVGRVPSSELRRVVPLLQAANQHGIAELASTIPNPRNRQSMLAHTLVVEPFSRGFSGLRARFSGPLFALTAMVALVLLVTCANIANLLLSRAAGRARDVGIRISLGATTGRLVRQCLTESLALAVFGGAAGLLFGEWASGVLARQVLGISGELPLVFSPDARVLAFAAGLSVTTAVVFGLAPALRAVSAGRTAALGTTQRQAMGHASMKGMRSLVVGQLALSVVVVCAGVLLGQTLVNFMRIDPGFSTDRLVTVSLDPIDSQYPADQTPALARRLVAAARGVPGVTSAAASRCGLIAGCSSSSGFRLENGGEGISLYQNWVTPDYFQTVGIPLVGGRAFNERDTEHSARVAVINESIARRYFPGQNPIGLRLGSSQLDTEIVGVVRDARTQTLHEMPVPMVYFPIDQQRPDRHTALTNVDARVDGDPRRAVGAVREAIRRTEPDLLVGGVGTMSQRLSRDLSRERLVAYLALSFGALTLLLASLGLYGVLSYGVARRTQEIGVRMALGARGAEVMLIVLGQSATLTGLGIVLGLLGTVSAARYLSTMLYGITPLDPITLVLVSIVFAVVTTCAAYLPARRATRIDPIVALRCE
ncbi:MAG TPA: ABC transporter permease [Vicinamibacterales bacterium]|nr:ABC transporter permease [Vicinamibacterales bacterium]